MREEISSQTEERESSINTKKTVKSLAACSKYNRPNWGKRQASYRSARRLTDMLRQTGRDIGLDSIEAEKSA